MNFFNLVKFHFKNYMQTSYFVILLITSTLSILLLQFIISWGTNSQIDPHIWIRTGIFGLWACGTTAAGIIGMQRWQGTIMYLINNPVSDYQSLSAVVLPAGIFGIFSFPLAYFLSILLNVQVTFSLEIIIYVLLFWIGAMTLDLVIAAFFVLTPNAIVYEELITLPVLLISGLFNLPDILLPIKATGQILIPISMPIQWLLKQEELTFINCIKYLTSLVIAYLISRKITTYLIQKARQTGSIGGGI